MVSVHLPISLGYDPLPLFALENNISSFQQCRFSSLRLSETHDCRICPNMRNPLKAERVVKHALIVGMTMI